MTPGLVELGLAAARAMVLRHPRDARAELLRVVAAAIGERAGDTLSPRVLPADAARELLKATLAICDAHSVPHSDVTATVNRYLRMPSELPAADAVATMARAALRLIQATETH